MMRKWRKWLVGAAIVVCIAFAGLLLICQAPQLKLPPPLPVPAIPSNPAEIAVADRRIVAEIIIDALQSYYLDCHQYPPYLFGGAPDVDPESGEPGIDVKYNWWGQENGCPELSPDPLIRGGYLASYPRVWPDSGDWAIASRPPFAWVAFDVRSETYWRCMYSTPYDYEVLGIGPELSAGWAAIATDPILALPWSSTGEEQLEHARSVGKSLILEGQVEVYSRYYALGGGQRGRIESFKRPELPRRYQCDYSWDSVYRLLPGSLDKSYLELQAHGQHAIENPSMPYFGYQRGEWFGQSTTEVWLWFYGSNIWPKRNLNLPEDAFAVDEEKTEAGEYFSLFCRFAWTKPAKGLDLLNTETGELEPDGIPDGICLLYKLKDGEVVEVVRAEDI